MADYLNERKKGEASTSRYIQMNTPDTKGNLTKSTSSVADTPDQGILNNLKKTINETITFEKFNILGVNILIPKIISKKIDENKPTSEKAEYGKIVVSETKGGHVFIKDDTPGNKRLVTQHSNGTYTAMVDNGDYTIKVINDSFEFVQGNKKIFIQKDRIEVLEGSNFIQIKTDNNLNIKGNNNINITGDDTSKINGNVDKDISGNSSERISGSSGIKIDTDLKTTVGTNNSLQVGNSWIVTVGGNININAGGNVNVTSGSVVQITAPIIKLN